MGSEMCIRDRIRETESGDVKEALRAKLKQKQEEGVFASLNLDESVTSIDLGNTTTVEPGTESRVISLPLSSEV